MESDTDTLGEPMNTRYALGLDYGTESARAVLVDVATGRIAATAVSEYAHGVMDTTLPDGTPLGHEWALQSPDDYFDSMREIVKSVMTESGAKPGDVIGLGVDFTACTILPVDGDNVPLCRQDRFQSTPHAWVKLWKHHAAQPQADRLNDLARETDASWLKVYGYSVSCEWLIPKTLQIIEEAPDVWQATSSIVEAGDWVVQQLTGSRVRSSCNAGYKACYVKGEGYPAPGFLKALHPELENLVDGYLDGPVQPPGSLAGVLTAEWASQLGLKAGTPVAVEIIDAHAAVPGCGVSDAHEMVLVMGTSTCHMLMSPNRAFVQGVSGVIEDGILPGMYGYEAGQACVGDHFAWWVRQGMPADYVNEAEERGLDAHQLLTEKAATQRPGEHGLLALDWWNGNRSILMDAELSGVLLGCTLSTKPEDIYRALIEATAFGTRMIVETARAGGVEVNGLVACGGLAAKNEMLMQIYADILGTPIRVAEAEHTSGLGAAILGAVAAGGDAGYVSLSEATEHMVRPPSESYEPIAENVAVYNRLYAEYVRLHDLFGRGGNDVLKTLKSIRGEIGERV
jgi:L-ribulokinase